MHYYEPNYPLMLIHLTEVFTFFNLNEKLILLKQSRTQIKDKFLPTR